MSIMIEHDKRRKKILRKALDVFMEEGFDDTTYQKIADRCKITRTTLYLYFRNRQEIFNFSIKQLLAEMEEDILKITENHSLSCPDKIRKTLLLILDRLEENRRLLSVILNYLLSQNTGSQKSAVKPRQKQTAPQELLPDLRVRRRTIRLRHILSAMFIEGIKKGHLRKIDLGAANELFYSFIEAAVFRLTVFKRESIADLKAAAELAVSGLVHK